MTSDERPDDGPRLRAAPPSLKAAVRRARIEDAERADVVSDLRGAEIARLEALQAALEPVLAQAPEEIDLFDLGLALGAKPRLFIDMIGYVEMARDKRRYRLVQNLRHGAVVIAETESLDRMTEAATDYIARRLVEREKALASDGRFAPPLPAKMEAPPARPEPGPPTALSAAASASKGEGEPPPSRERGALARAAAAGLDFIVSLAAIFLVAALVWFAWRLATSGRW
jgi:hypothetical protein